MEVGSGHDLRFCKGGHNQLCPEGNVFKCHHLTNVFPLLPMSHFLFSNILITFRDWRSFEQNCIVTGIYTLPSRLCVVLATFSMSKKAGAEI